MIQDLKTNNYYNVQFQGQDGKLSPAKQYSSQNTVGKIAGDLSSPEDDLVKELPKSLLYGLIPVKLMHWMNGKLVKNNSSGVTPFNKMLTKLDSFSNKHLKGLESVKNTLKKPINAVSENSLVKKYIKENSAKVKPVSNFAKGISRTLGGELTDKLLVKAKKLPGADTAKVEKISNMFKQGTISQEQAYKQVLNATKGAKTNPAFDVLKNKGGAVTGFVQTKSGKLVKQSAGKSLLSKAAKGMYSFSNKLFKPDLITMYFLGSTIKKAAEAPKGDKGATLAEGMAGEVIPYWILYNAMTRSVYQSAGILKGIPGKLGAPLRAVGNLLGTGLDKDASIQKLLKGRTIKGGEKILKNGSKRIIKDRNATGLYKKLAQRMANGSGGKKTAKLMGSLLKKSKVPFHKIARLKIGGTAGAVIRAAAVLFIVMPVVGGALKKISHKIFGKPQKTIDEEKVAKLEKEAKVNPHLNVQNVGPAENMKSPFIKKENAINQGQKSKSNQNNSGQESVKNSNSSLIEEYIQKMKNTDNNSSEKIANKDYFSAPEPLFSKSNPSGDLKIALEKTDRVINNTEKTLKNI